MNHMTRLGYRGRWIGLVMATTAVIGGSAGYTTGAVGHAATAPSQAGTVRPPVAAATTRALPAPLSPFPATGLPAGSATGVPQRLVLPAGFALKHTHGGPTYVYVIAGALIISDNAGVKTYPAGSFFWESPGHVHTVRTTRPSEAFVLTFLPPGADATIPVQ